MTDRLQYPIQASIDPEALAEPVAVKVEEYNPSFSEPIQQLRGVLFATVLIASSGMAPIDPETLSEPLRIRQHLPPLSEPVLVHPGLAYTATLAASGQIPTDLETLGDPEDVFFDGWKPPLSQPVLVHRGLAYTATLAAGPVPIDPETLGEVAYIRERFPPLSEPVLVHPGVAYAPTLAASGQAPIDAETLGDPEQQAFGGWRVPFSEPVLVHRGVAAAAALAASGQIPGAPTAFTPEAQAFRFYDDGTESDSAPKGAENDNIIIPATGDPIFQLRILVQETGGFSGLVSDDFVLEVSKNLGAFTSISDITTNVQAALGGLLDGVDTTNRTTDGISDGSGSFVIGDQTEIDAIATDRQLTASNFTEHVWSLRLVDADLAAGDTLDFQITFLREFVNKVVPRITIGVGATHDWFQALSQAVLPLPRYQHSASFDDPEKLGEITIVADTSLEDWWQPLSEPVLPTGPPHAAALAASGQAPIDPETLNEPVRTDEWFVPLSQPVLPIPRYQHTPLFFDPIRAVTFSPDADAFRFYNDDGDEDSSTAKASENTNISLSAAGDPIFHLRYRLQEKDGKNGLTTDDYSLQVSKNSGSFTTVDPTSSNVQVEVTSQLSDGSDTTNRADGISDGTGSFVVGEQADAGSDVSNRQLTKDDFTEHVWGLQLIDADLTDGDTLDFRMVLNAGTPGMLNSVTPRITVSFALEFWGPVSEPVLPLGPAYAAAQAASGQSPIDPETLSEPVRTDEWMPPLSGPVPRAAGLHASNQQAFVIDPETLNEAASTDEQLVPLSEPVPRAAGLHVSNQQAFAIDPVALDEPGRTDEWFAPLSEPVPRAAGLHASNQQAFAAIDPEALNDPEEVTFDGWLVPLSEPVLPIPRYQHPTLFDDYLGVTPADDTSHSWWRPLSEPVQPIPRYQHPASFDDPEELGRRPAADTSLEWFMPLSEPVIPIPRYQHQASFFGDSGTTFDSGNIDIAIGAATLTLTTTRPAVTWAPLYQRKEFLVPAENVFTVRPK